jgi:hypothetical protein
MFITNSLIVKRKLKTKGFTGCKYKVSAKCFKKACDSVKREVLYNILLEFGIPKKLVRLI